MKQITSWRVAAYALIGGAACTLRLIGWLPFLGLQDGAPLIPGLNDLMTLVLPLMFLSTGLLLRGWIRDPRGWEQVLISLAAIACVGLSLTCYRYNAGLLRGAAALCVGFLFPGRSLDESRDRVGWGYLLMLALSVFCYVAASVLRGRIFHANIDPDQQEMKRLMETLIEVSLPMLIMMVLYFTALFACSRAGQWIATRKWFLWLMLIPCVFSFVRTLSFYHWRWAWFWILSLLAQPVTLYTCMILARESKPKLWEERFVRIWDIFPSTSA